MNLLMRRLSSARAKAELSERQFRVPMRFDLFSLKIPLLDEGSKNGHLLRFRPVSSSVVFGLTLDQCKGMKSRALTVELFSESIMFSSSWDYCDVSLGLSQAQYLI